MARAHAYTTSGPKSRSRQTPRTSTGGPCLGARGKQAQLAQANGSKALHRGVGALNVLDQCSARSPRSVLEMVGASSRRTPRLPLTKGTRDRNAVEKRWWPTRRTFPISGAIMSTCSREHRGGVYLVPFFLRTFPQKFGGPPAPST